jgi:hypothetical protein
MQRVTTLPARAALGAAWLAMPAAAAGLSKLFLTIAAACAEAERDRIRERVAQVKRDQRQRGGCLGGKVPYGVRVGAEGALEAVPEQQAVIPAAPASRGPLAPRSGPSGPWWKRSWARGCRWTPSPGWCGRLRHGHRR